MATKELQLKDVININEWQRIQDALAEAFDVMIRTYAANADALTKASRPARLCSETLPGVPNESTFSAACLLSEHSGELLAIKKITPFKCHFGLDGYIVPIFAKGDDVAGFIVIGPMILTSRKEVTERARADADRHGLDFEELSDALIELNVLSHNKAHALVQAVENVFSYMARTGYHKVRLGEITPEVAQLDPAFARHYEDQILNSLLNTCTIALDADSGSVMTVDHQTKKLHIKAASKLSQEVIDGADINMGEGIAGVAAQNAESIILPKDKEKRHIADKLKREYIKSSIIMPFNKGKSEHVYGVINLNMVRNDREFSDRDIALVKELVNMASLALSPLRPPAAE